MKINNNKYKEGMNKIVVAYKQYGCVYRKHERKGKLLELIKCSEKVLLTRSVCITANQQPPS